MLQLLDPIYESVGQVPIVVRREIDGFILNRLQAVLLSEAFRLAGDGYVSPEDLDKTLKDGLGLRWSFMGPFETIELNAPAGIPDYCERYGPSLAGLAPQTQPSIRGIISSASFRSGSHSIPVRSPRACAGATPGSRH